MSGIGRDGKAALSLNEIKEELAALEAARTELLRESKVFRRLGFSTERISLRLCQVDARRAKCEEAIRQHKAGQQEKATTFA